MIKTIVIIAFIFIIFSLGSALYHLVTHKSEEHSEKTVKSLTYRIVLSLILFIFVFIAFATGMIKPHGIGANIQAHKPPQAENNSK